MKLKFGDCVFDGDTREVLRGGRAVAISPKAFSLLELLIGTRPRALSKAEIHDRLWPGIHVSEANLPNLVVELRAALGDEARRARVIRTVARFGYAFIGDARSVPRAGPASGPAYRLQWGLREIALDPGENLIGRDREAVVWIDDESVSRRHAQITIDGEGATIEDLGSKNGTYVGDARISKTRRLGDRDTVRVGPATMKLRVLKRIGSTRSTVKQRPSR